MTDYSIDDEERLAWEAYAPEAERQKAEEIERDRYVATDDDYRQPYDDSDSYDVVPEYDEPPEPYESEPDGPMSDYEPLEAVQMNDWSDDDVPKREWYWDGMFPLYQVGILSAEGGTGKSLLGSQAAAVTALRRETFLGRDIMGGPVIYLGAEDDENEFKRRFHDIARSEGVSRGEIKGLHLIPMADKDPLLSEPDKKGQMQPTATWHRLVETVRRVRPVALWLDTAADLFGGDEIKRVQVRQFVAMLRTLAIAQRVTIVLLYHPSQSGIESGTGKSGSTAWFNSVRSAVFMTEEKDDSGNLRRIRNTKSNYGKKGKGFVVKWQRGVFVLHDENAPPTPEETERRGDAEREVLKRLDEFWREKGHLAFNTPYIPEYRAANELYAMRPTTFTAVDFKTAVSRLTGDKLDIKTTKGPNGRDRKFLVLREVDSEHSRRNGEDI
ncbi:AAA family ATPase [Agrobacterium deltaense]|uniref:AAA family ATPase n=1 Tax=Agrobacterium deltaense TaxID=1183412 RepID=UPI001C6EB798|nr:AAA family ATPase [Agrobacterium deltaense]MBW9074941.1 AAA family ATPase [Agrobacterium deltaense]